MVTEPINECISCDVRASRGTLKIMILINLVPKVGARIVNRDVVVEFWIKGSKSGWSKLTFDKFISHLEK